MPIEFVPATIDDARLMIGLMGYAGSGKTFTALTIATELVREKGGPIAIVDTENNRAKKYANQFEFFHCPMTEDYSSEAYIDLIELAEKEFSVLIVDGLSPAWKNALDVHTRRSQSGNSFREWGPVKDDLFKILDRMQKSSCHIISTMRMKVDYQWDVDDNGKKVPVKIGMKPDMEGNVEYYFDFLGSMNQQHDLMITKTNIPELDNKTLRCPGQELGRMLLESVGAQVSTYDVAQNLFASREKKDDPAPAAHAPDGDAGKTGRRDSPSTQSAQRKEVSECLAEWRAEMKEDDMTKIRELFLFPFAKTGKLDDIDPSSYKDIIDLIFETYENKGKQLPTKILDAITPF